MSNDTRDTVPQPPNLHWLILLLLGIATVGLFFNIWMFVQAYWAKQFDPSSKALTLNIAGLTAAIVGAAMSTVGFRSVGLAIDIGGLVLMVIAIFSVRDTLGAYITEIERRPTYLSGVMTLFFAEVYIQYHMNRVRSILRRTAHATA